MSSMMSVVRRMTPRPVKRAARRVIRVGANSWIRGRAWILGVPTSAEAYDRFTLKLAMEFDCRLPLTARLGNGMTIKIAFKDYVSKHILASGYYEPETVALLHQFLKPGMVVFDVGAHVGQYSLVASRIVGQGGAVHSFEPDPETFAWLRGNCRSNKLGHVTLNQIALSDAAEIKTFYFATSGDIGSNSLAEPKNFSGRKAQVPCIQFDTYLQKRGITRVHLVKMDVEGAELGVLRGGESLFSGRNRPIMILEFEEARQLAFGSSCRALGAWLVEHGYELFRIGATLEPYTPSDGDPPSLNVLALPAETR
jgi:FkbM family methyltransferase